MPSFFFTVTKPRSGHQFCGFCYTFFYPKTVIRTFTLFFYGCVTYYTFVPISGTVLAHLGQARYPTWASTLPHLGTFAARMLPICPQ